MPAVMNQGVGLTGNNVPFHSLPYAQFQALPAPRDNTPAVCMSARTNGYARRPPRNQKPVAGFAWVDAAYGCNIYGANGNKLHSITIHNPISQSILFPGVYFGQGLALETTNEC